MRVHFPSASQSRKPSDLKIRGVERLEWITQQWEKRCSQVHEPWLWGPHTDHVRPLAPDKIQMQGNGR